MLSLFFTSMLSHGVSSTAMVSGKMVPIPKVKGTTKSENFSAITIGSVIAKLLDIIILLHLKDELFTSEQNMSSIMCTLMVEKNVNFYMQNGSNVFFTLLDASKAFDRVEYCKLFLLLLERGICLVVIKQLLYMYTSHKLFVQWNKCCSKASNGVKQGGIISPTLYCVYTDKLLLKLKSNMIGCYIGANFCGAFSCADDLIVLCPTVS